MVKYRPSEIAKKTKIWNNWGLGVKFESCKLQSSDLDFFFSFSCCYGNLVVKLQMSGVLTDLNGKDSDLSQGIAQLDSKRFSWALDKWLTCCNKHIYKHGTTWGNFFSSFGITFEESMNSSAGLCLKQLDWSENAHAKHLISDHRADCLCDPEPCPLRSSPEWDHFRDKVTW